MKGKEGSEMELKMLSLAASSDSASNLRRSGFLSSIKNMFRKNTLDAEEIQSPTSAVKGLSSESEYVAEIEKDEEDGFRSQFFEAENGPSADDLRNS